MFQERTTAADIATWATLYPVLVGKFAIKGMLTLSLFEYVVGIIFHVSILFVLTAEATVGP